MRQQRHLQVAVVVFVGAPAPYLGQWAFLAGVFAAPPGGSVSQVCAPWHSPAVLECLLGLLEVLGRSLQYLEW